MRYSAQQCAVPKEPGESGLVREGKQSGTRRSKVVSEEAKLYRKKQGCIGGGEVRRRIGDIH